MYDEKNEKVLGRYYGSFPKQAAHKTFTQLVKTRKKNWQYEDNKLIIFAIKECIMRSKKKDI